MQSLSEQLRRLSQG
ncbi:hypothetical protein ACTMF1_23525 [Escherichia coli]|nr:MULTISPECIES: hypothetical protein [Enterobacteriaceae]MDJ4435523.1 hypothetical protein [Salmonella enterica]MDJ5077437.1 hypothetical protein [Salmonella enterica]